MMPENLDEWAQYIEALSGQELWSKGIAANTLEFVQTLQDEEFSGEDIAQILYMMAQQFIKTDQLMPTDMPGQYLSYPGLVKSMETTP
jgi:hypothetical protein